jgi:hypothetical protein
MIEMIIGAAHEPKLETPVFRTHTSQAGPERVQIQQSAIARRATVLEELARD